LEFDRHAKLLRRAYIIVRKKGNHTKIGESICIVRIDPQYGEEFASRCLPLPGLQQLLSTREVFLNLPLLTWARHGSGQDCGS
jgi:hypothetical protein